MVEAEANQAEGDWGWARGASIVRRLERASEADAAAPAQILELEPGAWSPARAGAAGAYWVLRTASAVGAPPFAARAAAHACLLLSLRAASAGEEPRRHLPHLVSRVVHAEDAGVSAHRVRVMALLHALAHGDPHPAKSLVAFFADLLVPRVTATHTLSLVDALARMREPPGRGHRSEGWPPPEGLFGLVVHVVGLFPPATPVILVDGRRAVVIGPGTSGDPCRPLVLVGGRVLEPSAPVRFAAA